MLDAVNSEQSYTEQLQFGNNENLVIRSHYYDSWANDFISLLNQSIQKYDLDNPEKNLVRYLKLRITDRDGKLLPLNNLAIQDNTYSLPDEPISFNDDGALTVDFSSPVRVANIDSSGVLNIDPSFPNYDKIISMTKDLERVSDFLLEMACFNGDCDDVESELINRAIEFAEEHLDSHQLQEHISNINSNPLNTFVINHYRTTPEKIAFMAYARKASLETYGVDLSDLCMERGERSERKMMAKIGKELNILRSNPEHDIIGEIDTFMYDRYEELLDGKCLYARGM